MQWSDDGFILTTRLHGESSAIVEIMTRAHGRHLGLMRGAKSAKNRPLLQAGNGVSTQWYARLDEHLGQWSLELTEARAGRLMQNRLSLYGLNHLVDLLRLLPEREPHPPLYEAAITICDHLTDGPASALMMVRFELKLLDDLGFGLDLTECVATGTTEDLIYVSPKSGRAVSRMAGEPYKNRLLPLPRFCLGEDKADLADVKAGERLAGFFLNNHVFEPRGLAASAHRSSFFKCCFA